MAVEGSIAPRLSLACLSFHGPCTWRTLRVRVAKRTVAERPVQPIQLGPPQARPGPRKKVTYCTPSAPSAGVSKGQRRPRVQVWRRAECRHLFPYFSTVLTYAQLS
eukprot:4012528-Prymnesium_polylepis.3